jgi:outer membrane protein assembly factor BamB
VAGVDAATGKLLWRADRPGKTAVVPTPVYHDGMVFVTSGYGVGCNGFKVTKQGGSFAVGQVYTNATIGNHHGGVIRQGDFLYGHSDKDGWTCQEMKTGRVVWSDRGVGKGSVTLVDGLLICRSEDGPVSLVEATPEGYRERGRFSPPRRGKYKTWPHPVVSDGRLYLRDWDALYVFDVK